MSFDDVLAIIPARKGSKRMPGKNKAIFKGIPMWLNTVNIARDAGIKKIVVTTDDEEILSTAANTIYADMKHLITLRRSEKNAGDEATQDDVVYEVIHETERRGINIKTVCVLHVTSPLLTPTTLRHALHQFQDKKLCCLIAVNESTMKPCGAFYIFSLAEFKKFNNTQWMPGLSIYILDGKEIIDIDEIWDFRIAEALYSDRVVVK